MESISLLFPHQLFENAPSLSADRPVMLVEEYLFFRQYKFHKQKIAFHRASMKFYETYLQQQEFQVHYIDAQDPRSDVRELLVDLAQKGVAEIHLIDPTDDWLKTRVLDTVVAQNIELIWYENPAFLNTPEDLASFFSESKKKFYQTSFYKEQRVKRNLLMDQGKPMGGQWTFDHENRKKYPRKKQAPAIYFPALNEFYQEAFDYTKRNFSTHYGDLSSGMLYPITFEESRSWFHQFLQFRFDEFGTYEDAIVAGESILNHSVLSPLINVGLLDPEYVINEVVLYSEKNKIPINSSEGLIRQLIGWREFIRGVYEVKGRQERTTNFWKHERKIPKSFYQATTGIEPIDLTIKKIMKTGYAHHIERLMVLGNFMVLCEFDPDEVYRWFMELFIDSYDWVMVPNVYGMSLFADGGLMSTKPYISSSNYLMKMSDYPKGAWQEIWDGLFWRFMDKHRSFFLKNPRLSMLIRSFDKMDTEKRTKHLETAAHYLNSLDAE